MNYEDAIIAGGAERVANLSQPHFDEEATLIAARPVVPLAEVKQRDSRKRWLVFASVIVLAILVGAGGATFLYTRRAQPVVQDLSLAISDVRGRVNPLDVTEIGAANEMEVEDPTVPAETEVGPPPVASKETTSVSHVKPGKNDRSPSKKAPTVRDEVVPDNGSWQETRRRRVQERREDLIEERRQERRDERREARRQRRGREQWRRSSANDLFRVREIFEGPRP